MINVLEPNKEYTVVDALWDLQQIVRLSVKNKLKKLEIKELEGIYER